MTCEVEWNKKVRKLFFNAHCMLLIVVDAICEEIAIQEDEKFEILQGNKLINHITKQKFPDVCLCVRNAQSLL